MRKLFLLIGFCCLAIGLSAQKKQNVAREGLNCIDYVSDLSMIISEIGTPGINNEIFIPDDLTISDVTINIDLTHTQIGDLDARLIAANEENILLFDRPGFPNNDFGCSGDNLLLSFNANSVNTASVLENSCNASNTGVNVAGPPHAVSGEYQTIGNLTALNNQSSYGIWTLVINDNEVADGGLLEAWSITICYELVGSEPELVTNAILPVAYGQALSLTNTYLQAVDNDNSSNELIYRLNTPPAQGSLSLNGQLLEVEDTFTQQDIDNGLVSYTHQGGSISDDTFNFDLRDASGFCLENNVFYIEIIATNFTASIAQTSVIFCNGGSNAVIETSVEGGAPPYTYRLNGGPFQSNSTFSGLTAGSYNVNVVDQFGTIVGTNTVVINQPAVLMANLVVDEDQITVNTTGGTPGYTYFLNGSTVQTDNLFEGLANGDYSATVVDANGCLTTTATVQVSVNTLALNAVLSKGITCFNQNDASVSITATGGTPPLQYRLNDGLLQAGSLFENLPAGTYIPEVVDSEGFTRQTNSIFINNPPALNAEAIVDGDIVSIVAQGGTPPLRYQLNDNLPQASSVFENMANGVHSIRTIDSNDCEVVLSATVAVNTLALSAMLTEELACFDDANATIRLFVSGGTPPLQFQVNEGPLQNNPIFEDLPAGTYIPQVVDSEGFTRQTNSIFINNPPALTAIADIFDNTIVINAEGGTPPLQYQLNNNSLQESNVFENVANGFYTIRTIDANGCEAILSATIAFNTLAISATLAEDLACANDENGIITLAVSGGTPPLQYRLNDEPWQASPIFEGLAAGTYVPAVSDSEGFARQTTAVIINNPPVLTAQVEVFQSNIIIDAQGGTPPLDYQLNNGASQNNNIFENVANGTYSVHIIDANDCELILPATVAVNTLSIGAILTEDLDCFNDETGVITLTVNGGTPPFLYQLNDGDLQDVPIFTDLAAGTYLPQVIDSQGFTREGAAVLIENPLALTADLNVEMNSVTVTAAGGTPPLYYQLDDGELQTANVFTNLVNGTYNIRVVDANECSVTLGATILINDMEVVAELLSSLSCSGDENAAIGTTVTGGTPPFLYSLNNGPFLTLPDFYVLGAGTYAIKVMDANGFLQTSNTLVVDEPDPLMIEVDLESADLTINASGGTAPYEYSIDNENWLTNAFFPDLPDGIYQVRVRDANDCTIIQSVTIAVTSLEAAFQVIDSVSCFGVQDAAFSVLMNGGIAPYLYSLNGVDFQESNVFDSLGGGIYNVSIQDQSGTILDTICNINEPALLSLSLTVDGSSIFASATGGTAPFSYQLNGGISQEEPVFSDLAIGEYEVVVTDANDCTSIQTVSILVDIFDIPYQEWRVELYPNPNQGQFQLSIPETIQEDLQLYIYNTAGQLVWQQLMNKQTAVNTYFDLNIYPAGVYQMIITDGNKVGIVRFVKK